MFNSSVNTVNIAEMKVVVHQAEQTPSSQKIVETPSSQNVEVVENKKKTNERVAEITVKPPRPNNQKVVAEPRSQKVEVVENRKKKATYGVNETLDTSLSISARSLSDSFQEMKGNGESTASDVSHKEPISHKMVEHKKERHGAKENEKVTEITAEPPRPSSQKTVETPSSQKVVENEKKKARYGLNENLDTSLSVSARSVSDSFQGIKGKGASTTRDVPHKKKERYGAKENEKAAEITVEPPRPSSQKTVETPSSQKVVENEKKKARYGLNENLDTSLSVSARSISDSFQEIKGKGESTTRDVPHKKPSSQKVVETPSSQKIVENKKRMNERVAEITGEPPRFNFPSAGGKSTHIKGKGASTTRDVPHKKKERYGAKENEKAAEITVEPPRPSSQKTAETPSSQKVVENEKKKERYGLNENLDTSLSVSARSISDSFQEIKGKGESTTRDVPHKKLSSQKVVETPGSQKIVENKKRMNERVAEITGEPPRPNTQKVVAEPRSQKIVETPGSQVVENKKRMNERLAEITVEPPRFNFPSAGGKSTHVVRNIGTGRKALKVKCSDQDVYLVSHVYFFVAAAGQMELTVIRGAGPAKEDKLVIHYANVAADAVDAKAAFEGAPRAGSITIPLISS